MTTEDEYQIVCHNIRILRKNYGLSRTAMAKRIHVSMKTLDCLEAGVFPDRIRIHFFYNVERAFGIPPKKMLTVRLQDDS